jgi:hypothetical protein
MVSLSPRGFAGGRWCQVRITNLKEVARAMARWKYPSLTQRPLRFRPSHQGAHQESDSTFRKACLTNAISFGFRYYDFQNDRLTFRDGTSLAAWQFGEE